MAIPSRPRDRGSGIRRCRCSGSTTDCRFRHTRVPETAAPTLYAREPARLEAGQCAVIPTGIAVAISDGFAGLAIPRSGRVADLSALPNSPCLLDHEDAGVTAQRNHAPMSSGVHRMPSSPTWLVPKDPTSHICTASCTARSRTAHPNGGGPLWQWRPLPSRCAKPHNPQLKIRTRDKTQPMHRIGRMASRRLV